ncbi:uncharacterized protein [Haliotis asinina]|uniref:uncharacterized protein isoform X2 n=2 Tax=Haliotis asinina TaxID=109174 RepID=UPI0035319990
MDVKNEDESTHTHDMTITSGSTGFTAICAILSNVTVAHLENKQDPESVTNDQCIMGNVSGQLTDKEVYIRGTATIECELASSIFCVLYGYSDSDYKTTRFKPKIEFDADVENVSITRRRVLSNDSADVSIMTCSLEAGSRASEMWWLIGSSDKRFSKADPSSYTVTRRNGPGCHVHVFSELRLEAGERHTQFKCMFGLQEVGSIAGGGISLEPEDALSGYLFLSTGILVYPHFVFLPPFCDFLLARKVIPESFRDPKTPRSRKRRAFISLFAGFIFSVWWLIVIHDAYAPGFLCFFLMESVFFILYAGVRLLPERFEKDGERLLYNSRVALSCGAVITPGICWLIMRTQMQLEVTVQEIVWLIFTVFSLIAFVSVSNKREWKTWDKRI